MYIIFSEGYGKTLARDLNGTRPPWLVPIRLPWLVSILKFLPLQSIPPMALCGREPISHLPYGSTWADSLFHKKLLNLVE